MRAVAFVLEFRSIASALYEPVDCPVRGSAQLGGTPAVDGTKKGMTAFVLELRRAEPSPQSREFETEVLKPLRDLLKLKPSPCPVCGRARKLTSHCPQHE